MFLDGFHVLFGEGSRDVLNFVGKYRLMKCVESWDICLAAKRLDPSLIIVARSLVTDYGTVDCPPDWMWGDPSLWWDGIKNHLPNGFDYYEVQNECGPPPQGWPYWAEWSIKIAGMVERDKGGKLLAFSFPPGNPDYPQWPLLIDYLRFAAATGHGVAIHSAAFATFPIPEGDVWVNNEHVANRMEHVCIYLRNAAQFDCRTVLWITTETGLTDGYSGQWGGHEWSCAQEANAYQTTRDFLKKQGIVRGFAWWNVGLVGRWKSVHSCLAEMLKN